MKDNQAKYPQLRFKGFTDPWEQRKFSNLVKKVGKHPSVPGDYTAYSVSNVDGLIPQTQQFDGSRLDVLDKSAYKVVNPGEFAYNPARINVGSIAYNDLEFPVLVSSLYVVVRMDQAIDDEFILQFIRSPQFLKEVRRNTEGSVREYLFFDNFKNVRFPFALNIEEQQKVGSFLRTMDDTIALHQRKLAKLKELKQGYLQKLFPKNGSKFPQLRFAGFADAWEQRKLSDLFIKGGSGGTPKSTNKAFYDGDIPFLGISDITKSNGFINNTEKHISSDGLNSSAAWIVSKGAISLAMYASVGKLAILNIDAATSQAFYNMIFDDYDLRDLVYQRLNKANELSEWNKLISTGTQSNLNADKVKNFQMYLPKNHDEIKLISTFFKQIDNTIARQQRKLEKLQELKKGYLQKMFC
ncbi:restriction endonuclease subunit S (plasmid) [Loigolactobacillus backii]|uniref:restriction endonuclease subunit S n=1 Tax=Loigolactobacillus backii TaxID=375175 RepID=UPI0007F0A16B|nr:restriction endonuclease subunit S [Loigolactobacillus backii]ANK66038.1 restriction endonuclease subunit S [Loigolactobacillus backii]